MWRSNPTLAPASIQISKNQKLLTDKGNAPHHASSQDPAAWALKKKNLAYQSAMTLAKSPGSSLLMTGFMLWLTGNSLQLFSIIMLLMSMRTPIVAIMGTQKTFSRYEESDISLLVPKVVYIALNLAAFGMCLYKAQAMGLIPTLMDLQPLPVQLADDVIVALRET